MKSLYNLILENIFLPLGDLVTSSSVVKHLNTIRCYDNLNDHELVELQYQKLTELLEYAVSNSPYYKNLKIERENNAVDWLKKFPILEKDILRKYESEILTISPKGLNKISSSGSTGEKSWVYLTQDELSYIRANQIHWWEWAGYQIGDKILQTGISKQKFDIKQLKNLLFRTKYIKAFSHSPQELVATVDYIRKNKGIFLVGFASSLYLIAQKAKELKHTDFQVKGIISLGGKLFAEYREIIELVFQSKVFDTYGCGEGIGVSSQKDLDFMYIITPNTYIEIVDDQGMEVKDGVLGHVLLTNLNAKAFPLIRYRIGDLASILPRTEYPAQREFNYPLLKSIIGRDTDIVRTNSGKFLVVHSFTAIFKYFPTITQFCVIQRDLSKIELQYITSEGFKESDLNIIQKKIDDALGEHLPVIFQKVEFIAPTASGKPQMIQSYIRNFSLNV